MTVLGDLLRGLRGKRSLREISKRSGVSHNYLNIVEKGVDPRSGTPVEPSPETLKKLANAYDYDYEKLMIAAGYLSNDTAAETKVNNIKEETEADKKRKIGLEYIRKIKDPKSLELAIKLLRELSEE